MSTRISTAQIFHRSQEHIRSAKEKENISADKSSSMKELDRPSQAPAEWTIAANLKDDVSVRETLAKNASMATHALTAAENIMTQAQDITQKLHELALSASGTAVGDVSRHLLPEAQGLYQSLVQAFNTRFGSRTVLAGYKSEGPAFDLQGNFLGDSGKIEIEIDRGLKVPINVSGEEAVLGKGLKDGVNILATVQQLIAGLQVDDKELIRGSLEGLNKATDQLSLSRTRIAGSMLEIERAINTNSMNNISNKDAISKIEEADAIKVFSELARDQTVLRAAMETSRKLLTESPVDILFK